MSAGSRRGHATVRGAFPCADCERSFDSAIAIGIHRARIHGAYSQNPDAVRQRTKGDAVRVKVPGKGWEEQGPRTAGGMTTVRSPFAGAADIAASASSGLGSGPVEVRQGTAGDQRIDCPDCTFKFVSEDALRRHRAFKHPEPIVDRAHEPPFLRKDEPIEVIPPERETVPFDPEGKSGIHRMAAKPTMPCEDCLHRRVCGIRERTDVAMLPDLLIPDAWDDALHFTVAVSRDHYWADR